MVATRVPSASFVQLSCGGFLFFYQSSASSFCLRCFIHLSAWGDFHSSHFCSGHSFTWVDANVFICVSECEVSILDPKPGLCWWVQMLGRERMLRSRSEPILSFDETRTTQSLLFGVVIEIDFSFKVFVSFRPAFGQRLVSRHFGSIKPRSLQWSVARYIALTAMLL